MRLLLCAAIVALAACAARAAEPPTTATQYSVSGAIHLPYANLTEPFTVYFDAPGQRERVEYYGGVNVVLTRVAENRSDEIVPVGGVEGSTTTCFGATCRAPPAHAALTRVTYLLTRSCFVAGCWVGPGSCRWADAAD